MPISPARPSARWTQDVRALIAEHGIRNALLTSVAPTGTISLVADNVSSGIEPVFALPTRARCCSRTDRGSRKRCRDYALRRFRAMFGDDAPLPRPFRHRAGPDAGRACADAGGGAAPCRQRDLEDLNVPEDIGFEAFQAVYLDAYRSGCKGCTTYRPNAITGSVLEVTHAPSRPALPSARSRRQPADCWCRSSGQADRRHLQAALAGQRARDVRHHQRCRAGRLRRPFEIFVNSKNLEHYAWVVALTRMISAVFRRGGEVAFVAEELKQVFDPRGGQWIERPLCAVAGRGDRRHYRAPYDRDRLSRSR